MSLESLKKQAGRLASYLGAKHRVNLKHASALEVVAAMHGARNWQTLAAGAPPQADEAPPKPGTKGVLALSWTAAGEPHVTLPQGAWLRHGIAFGDTAYAWVQDNLFEAAEAGLSALLLAHPDDFVGMASETADGFPVHLCDVTQLKTLASTKFTGLVVVSTPAGSNWSTVLLSCIQARLAAGERSPLVIGIPGLDRFTGQELDDLWPLAQQGRSLGITLRCYSRTKLAVQARTKGPQVLAQMAHQMFLGNAREAAQEEVLERLNAAPAVYLGFNTTQF